MGQADEKATIWMAYINEHNARPKNASQLMKFSKKSDKVKTLSFSEAKSIFAVKIKEPMEDIKSTKPKVDMTQEKQDLKEYIIDCKEDLETLQDRELKMEDDYEEGNEEVQNMMDEL